MSLTCTCSNCGVKIRYKQEQAGRTVRCPNQECRQPLPLPKAGDIVHRTQPPAIPSKASAALPVDDVPPDVAPSICIEETGNDGQRQGKREYRRRKRMPLAVRVTVVMALLAVAVVACLYIAAGPEELQIAISSLGITQYQRGFVAGQDEAENALATTVKGTLHEQIILTGDAAELSLKSRHSEKPDDWKEGFLDGWAARTGRKRTQTSRIHTPLGELVDVFRTDDAQELSVANPTSPLAPPRLSAAALTSVPLQRYANSG